MSFATHERRPRLLPQVSAALLSSTAKLESPRQTCQFSDYEQGAPIGTQPGTRISQSRSIRRIAAVAEVKSELLQVAVGLKPVNFLDQLDPVASASHQNPWLPLPLPLPRGLLLGGVESRANHV